MKEIYKNSLGEHVVIKVAEGHCVINVKDEEQRTAEICIPISYAVTVAHSIIRECERQTPKKLNSDSGSGADRYCLVIENEETHERFRLSIHDMPVPEGFGKITDTIPIREGSKYLDLPLYKR